MLHFFDQGELVEFQVRAENKGLFLAKKKRILQEWENIFSPPLESYIKRMQRLAEWEIQAAKDKQKRETLQGRWSTFL